MDSSKKIQSIFYLVLPHLNLKHSKSKKLNRKFFVNYKTFEKYFGRLIDGYHKAYHRK